MKRILGVLSCLMLLLGMAGWSSEQSATYVLETAEEGLFTMTDTQSFKAKGDKVYQLTEVTVLTFAELDAAVLDMLVEYYDATVAAMQENIPTGVTVGASYEDRTYTMEIAIDLKTADLEAVSEGGYLMGPYGETGEVKQVSFEQTAKALEASGYTLLKE